MQTGGSRSAGTPVGWSLDFVRDRAVNLRLAEAARGPARRRYAVWSAPGSAALAHLLDIYARGVAPDRWYSPVDPASPELPAPYRWSAHLLRAAGRFCNRPLPRPVHVPTLAPGPIVDWFGSVLAAARGPVPPHAAQRRPSDLRGRGRRDVSLEGTEVAVGGEPITAARVAAMRRAGLRVLPRYAAAEAGLIGDGLPRAEWLRRRSRPPRPGRGRPARRGGRRLPRRTRCSWPPLRPTAPLCCSTRRWAMGALEPRRAGVPCRPRVDHTARASAASRSSPARG